MKLTQRLVVLVVVVVCALVAIPATSYADATTSTQTATPQQTFSQDAVPIYDAAGLQTMAQNPTGSYRLMADVDLTGVAWQPLDFQGTLEGDGHAILNASVSGVGGSRRTTYDGNLKSYDTVFSGFFGTLEGAVVRNVRLLGVEVDAVTDEPTFVGCLCGYMDNATIENCMVVGEASLATSGACFGVGGIAGFGNGRILSNTVDATLVCRDTDAQNKDEQFMGGGYANGYADLESNAITIRGYDSDHGYVHDGGMAGMYILYPEGTEYAGTITNNHVSGFITFFEDNEDRRAYCDPEIGENMSPDNITRGGNTNDFTADERFEYGTDLLPHTCANPTWNDQQLASSCTEWGCTQRICTSCGYSYRTAWLPRSHKVDGWTLEGTPQSDGSAIRKGVCTACGETVYEHVSASEATGLSHQPNEAQANIDQAQTHTATVSRGGKGGVIRILVIGAAVAAAVALLGLIIWTVVHKR